MTEYRIIKFKKLGWMCYLAKEKNRYKIDNISIHPDCKDAQLELDFTGSGAEFTYICPEQACCTDQHSWFDEAA